MTTLSSLRHDRRRARPAFLWLLALVMLGALILWRHTGADAAPATVGVELVSAPTVAQPGSTATIVWRITGDEKLTINKVYFGYNSCSTASCYSYSTANQPGAAGQYTATLSVDATIYFRVVASNGVVTKETPEQIIRVPQVFSPFLASSRSNCYPWPGDIVTATWTINRAALSFEDTSFHWDTATHAGTHNYPYAPGVSQVGSNEYQALLTVPNDAEEIFGAARLDINGWNLWSSEASLRVGPGRFRGFRPLPPYLPRGRTIAIAWDAEVGFQSSSVQSALLYDTVSHAGEPALGSYPFFVESHGSDGGGRVNLGVPTSGERLYMRAYVWDHYNCMGGNNESQEVSLPIQAPLDVLWLSTPNSAARGGSITVEWYVGGKQSVGTTRVEADFDGDNVFGADEYWSPNQSGGMGIYSADVPVPASAATLRLRALASDGIVYYSQVRTIPLTGDQPTPTPTATVTRTPTATPTPTATAPTIRSLWLPLLIR